MTKDEYTELMLFYLLGIDTTGYKYAAVDADGRVHIYKSKPVLDPNRRYEDERYMWIPYEECHDDGTGKTSGYRRTGKMPLHDFDWKETLIEI